MTLLRRNRPGQGRPRPSRGFLIAIEAGDEKTAWGVIVPDLPGCFSAGDTLEEAIGNAAEAVNDFVRRIVECGAQLPEPLSFASHQHHPDYAGMSWATIVLPSAVPR